VAAFIEITKRKQAQEALAEQLDFNQREFNSTDAHLAVLEAEGTILDINAAWRRFAKENQGMDESKWGVGASYFVPYDKEWGDTAMASEAFDGIRKVQCGLLPYFSLEYPCHSPGGEKRWFDMRALPLQGKDGKVLVTHTNITELKRAEESQLVTLVKYKTLFECSPLGITVSDGEGKILESNSTALKLLGASQEMQTQHRINGPEWHIVRPDGTSMPSEEFASVRALKEKCSVENVEMGIVQSDNTIIWISVTAVPLPLEGFGVAITYHDITERKRAEESMFRNQAMLARTERIANVGSWEWDIATDTVSWSNELFNIFQRTPNDGVPSFAEHSKLYYPEDMQRLRVAVEAAISNGTPYEMELRAIRKDGETRVCLVRGYAEMDPGKSITRLFGSLQDITDRKQAEAEKEILEAQYRQLQKSESLGRMAGAIAHHFNNQLQVVMMNLDFALRSKSSGEFPTENLTGAMQSARKAAEVSTLMLTYSVKPMPNVNLWIFPKLA
jgi:PAS domain S-box-containing protein